MDIFYIIVFDIGILIQCLCQGYRMDEQTYYPHDGKHSIVVPKKLKRFVFLNKIECLRVAFIMEIVGYIEFTVIAILFIAFSILNSFPDRENFGAILGSIILLNGLYLVLTGVYYGIKNKFHRW